MAERRGGPADPVYLDRRQRTELVLGGRLNMSFLPQELLRHQSYWKETALVTGKESPASNRHCHPFPFSLGRSSAYRQPGLLFPMGVDWNSMGGEVAGSLIQPYIRMLTHCKHAAESAAGRAWDCSVRSS
ncbi:uncharacterized protein ACDP82_016648 isoform 1-T1 [Pangshura tecta]